MQNIPDKFIYTIYQFAITKVFSKLQIIKSLCNFLHIVNLIIISVYN